jgi:hypothetical protein
MRQIPSILLIFTSVIPVAPVPAQDVGSILILKERLSNMDAEVERFLESNNHTKIGLRYTVCELPLGTFIRANLHDGRTVHGRLKKVTEKGLLLDERQFVTFEEVATIQTQGLSGTTNYKGVLIIVGALLVVALVAVLTVGQ